IAAAGIEAGDIPDPLDDATFAASRIETLDELDERQRAIRAFCQSMIAARRRFVTPLLGSGAKAEATWRRSGEAAISVHWDFGDGRWLMLLANYGAQPASIPTPDALVMQPAYQLREAAIQSCATTLGGYALVLHLHGA